MKLPPKPACRSWLAIIISLLPAAPLLAFEPVQGIFVARQDCPATTGIKARPDGVSLKPGQRYAALGLNKPDGDHLQLRVPGARPEPRWVARTCGDWPAGEESDDAAGSPAAINPPAGRQPTGASPTPAVNRPGRVLLALSWQPAFCERQAAKPECRDQTAGRFDADHLSLHGLWPQPQGLEYCQVDAPTRAQDRHGNWMNLPPPALLEDTLQQLRQAMPGAASGLERHEWLRHGSCFGADADHYFRTALALLEQINRSALRDTLARRVGDPVAVSEL
ncbi:MAG: ribonuclease T2 family protein, partial [Methylococcus sp.]